MWKTSNYYQTTEIVNYLQLGPQWLFTHGYEYKLKLNRDTSSNDKSPGFCYNLLSNTFCNCNLTKAKLFITDLFIAAEGGLTHNQYL